MDFKQIKKRITFCMLGGLSLALIFTTGCFSDESEDVPASNAKKWTIMYYGDADCDLEVNLMEDIAEMKAGFVDGQNVDLIVLMDRNPGSDTTQGYTADSAILNENFSDTRLFKITSNRAVRIGGSTQFPEITTTSTYEANMGDAKTLKKFIQFCKANYPATDYALIFSNHGGGPKKKNVSSASSMGKNASGISKSICWDESGDGTAATKDDFLYTAEISDTLTSAESVQLFGLDACLMSSVEFAYQFRDDSSNTGFKAEIMVASAPLETGNGWAYTDILKRLNAVGGDNGSTDKTSGGNERYYDPRYLYPDTFGAIIVEEQRDSTTADADQSLTCLDLSLVTQVKKAVDAMAVKLAASTDRATLKTELEATRGNAPDAKLLHYFEQSSDADWLVSPFFDLYNLASAINMDFTLRAVKSEAWSVLSAVDSMVLYSFGNSVYSGFQEGKSGVHIFFPDGKYKPTVDTTDDGVDNPALLDICWKYQFWYTSVDLYALNPDNGIGKLAWCIDGAIKSDSSVQNWFELLDSWYDTGNTSTGGLNAYQW